jgi:hypothetical protein
MSWLALLLELGRSYRQPALGLYILLKREIMPSWLSGTLIQSVADAVEVCTGPVLVAQICSGPGLVQTTAIN